MQEIEEKETTDPEEPEKNQKGQDLKKKIAVVAGFIIALSGILCLIGGIVIIIYQFYYWLKIGRWFSMPFSVILSKVISLNYLHHLEWKGISKILLWIVKQPSSLLLIICGCIITVIGDIIRLQVTRDYKESKFKK